MGVGSWFGFHPGRVLALGLPPGITPGEGGLAASTDDELAQYLWAAVERELGTTGAAQNHLCSFRLLLVAQKGRSRALLGTGLKYLYQL